MKNCFIFGAVTVNSLPVKPGPGDYIMAADKGLLNVERLGLTADIVIGDFDSLGFIPKDKNTEVLPVRKDDTDIGYCLKKAISKGYKNVFIYGGLGGKVDHTFANIQLSAFASQCGARAIFIDDNCCICSVTDGTLKFENAVGRISVFCIGDKAEGVTLSGLSYPLTGATLDGFFPLGVSNEFLGGAAALTVRHGTLTVMWEGGTLPES